MRVICGTLKCHDPKGGTLGLVVMANERFVRLHAKPVLLCHINPANPEAHFIGR
jgi:hypothetical protein